MMKRMTKMTQYEIHIELLKILKEIDLIFKKHDIQYFLIFGSLLGCVRDGGYIPWDDDIDIAVMPEYWDKMNKVLVEEIDGGRYFVINKHTRPNYPIWHLLTRVGVNKTARKMNYFKEGVDGRSGIFIDIFSVVKAPENKIRLKVWDWKLGQIDNVINMKAYKSGTYRRPSVLSKILCRTKYKNSSLCELNKIRSQIQCSYNNSGEKYITVPFGPYGRYPIEKTKYRLQWVRRLEMRTFSVFNAEGEAVESARFPIPSDYEKILETTYGEWRVRPKGERAKAVSYWIGERRGNETVDR